MFIHHAHRNQNLNSNLPHIHLQTNINNLNS